MRLKRSRVGCYFVRTRTINKDNEGNTFDTYDKGEMFTGEVWPASGKVQAELYGERLSYIRNVRIEGSYIVTTDRAGKVHYVYSHGLHISESDGICLYVDSEENPDYKVISIKPFSTLKLEAEKV